LSPFVFGISFGFPGPTAELAPFLHELFEFPLTPGFSPRFDAPFTKQAHNLAICASTFSSERFFMLVIINLT
jgi:hypothetical protein